MRLTEHVALAGSGDLAGIGLTHPLDCNLFLIDGSSELALVDAGSGQDVPAVLDSVRRAGFAPERVRYLFVTHTHFDHAGGTRALRDRLGLAVVASELAAAILTTGDEEAISLPRAKAAGSYPAHVRFDACPVDVVLADSATVMVGDVVVRGIATPGHSRDHMAFLAMTPGGSLFSGDSVLAGGRILIQNVPDCDLAAYVATIGRLADLEVEALFPGHGLWSVRRGSRHLRAAKATVDRLAIPPNLFVE
jgi:glyoxylase-like metal-dependent hydrolase (beta-lactamase superfamily II)